MKKTILEIYALAVCFFTVACFVVTLGFASWDIVELSAPEFTISSHQFECHQTNQEYKSCFSNEYQYTREDNPLEFPSGDALTQKRTSDYSQILKSEQRRAWQGLVQKFIILFIDLIVFFGHWVLAKRAREQQVN